MREIGVERHREPPPSQIESSRPHERMVCMSAERRRGIHVHAGHDPVRDLRGERRERLLDVAVLLVEEGEVHRLSPGESERLPILLDTLARTLPGISRARELVPPRKRPRLAGTPAKTLMTITSPGCVSRCQHDSTASSRCGERIAAAMRERFQYGVPAA